ncbi:tetratricopeptide repeat protein [Vibrio chaetopteri]|uniref:tetratricopeptide repeat protein n=1 Tax=Vibrio chaetopteri TaxID=3016528 RepID=UPI003AB83472
MPSTEPIPKPITEQQVQTTLEKIVVFPPFYSSPKLVAFLRYVVEQTLAGQGSQLTQYSIATDLFEKPASFNPSSDPMVRMLATKLRKLLTAFYESNNDSELIVISLPKRNYMPEFAVKESTEPSPLIPNINYPTLVVQPFAMTLQDPICNEVALSLQEELSYTLGLFEQLAVISPLRVQEMAGGSLSLSEFRDKLGARYVVSGSVRRAGESLRVTVALNETEHGLQIWSERFVLVVTSEDVLGDQLTVVQRIATKMASSYGVISMHEFQRVKQQDSVSLNDYQARLYYLEYLTKMSQERLQDMITLYQQLVAGRYANDARTLATLAQLYCDALLFGMMSYDEVIERCEKLVSKALDYTPRDGEVILAQAWWALLTNNPQKVSGCAERIIQLNPNSHYTIGAVGWLVCLSGNFDYGIKILTNLLGKDDYFPIWLKLSQALNAIRQQDNEAALQSLDLFYAEGNVLQTTLLALIYQVAGQEETARQYWSEAKQSVIDIDAIAAQQLDVMILDNSLRATLEHARLSLANITD